MNYFICCRVTSSLALTVAQMMQKLFASQAVSQVAREPTRVHAKKLSVVETLICIVLFTTGSVQPKTKEESAIFNFNLGILDEEWDLNNHLREKQFTSGVTVASSSVVAFIFSKLLLHKP